MEEWLREGVLSEAPQSALRWADISPSLNVGWGLEFLQNIVLCSVESLGENHLFSQLTLQIHDEGGPGGSPSFPLALSVR